jgi:hypothetical protein
VNDELLLVLLLTGIVFVCLRVCVLCVCVCVCVISYLLCSGGSEVADYMWTGMTHFEVAELQPGEQLSFATKVCVLKPGTFNINRFKFTVQLTELSSNQKTEFTIFYPFAQHLLTVVSSSPSSFSSTLNI